MGRLEFQVTRRASQRIEGLVIATALQNSVSMEVCVQDDGRMLEEFAFGSFKDVR
jgi:hypothetical protein